MAEFNKRNARSWSIMGVNPSIWSVGVLEIMEHRDDVAVVTADLARYSGLGRIAERFPDRFYNVGIAEQNMVGVSAGLALEGMTVLMTTYAPFVTLRCADQVRHLMGNHNLNIKAIGSAAGITGGWSGPSLNVVNDIAFMRSIPNMVVATPADCMEAVKMVQAVVELPGPAYVRFGGATRLPVVHQDDYQFAIGKGIVLREGSDVALIACGTQIVSEALKAADLLEERHGIKPTVVDMHTVKPLDNELVETLAQTHPFIVTVEEHSVVGGLGGSIAECISEGGFDCRLLRCGIPDEPYLSGSRSFMLEQAGLTAERLAKECERIMGER